MVRDDKDRRTLSKEGDVFFNEVFGQTELLWKIRGENQAENLQG